MKRILELFPHSDIGWKDINETFIRYKILETPWFRIYVHNLIAPRSHPQCHDHPWSFIALVLYGGYNEYTVRTGWKYRRPGSILYRPHSWTHNVTTSKCGMWSLVLAGPKRWEWGFKSC